MISALATRKTLDEFEFTPESFFEAVLDSYKESYPEEILTRPMETPGITAAVEKAANHGRKRPRCDSNTWIPSVEDGKKEVAGILRALKEVQARGRKRVMIG